MTTAPGEAGQVAHQPRGSAGRAADQPTGQAGQVAHQPTRRSLVELPKAHLHLHLTGGMRPSTLVELAEVQGRRLPAGLLDPSTADLDVTVLRGWHKFQRLYDAARELLRGPAEVRRVITEIVEDEAAAGSGWLELQVDPTTYAARLGGLTATVSFLLDALTVASATTGVGTGLVLAANRTRHPAEAETLARLARRFVDRPGGTRVVGFGLANDESRGDPREFAKAFRLARDVGLLAVPHAGELRGAGSIRRAVEVLGAHRLGHGVRSVEDPAVLDLLAERGVVLEICPASNLALGVVPSVAAVPVPQLRAAGILVALGADDPLVFRSGLVEQYSAVREAHALADEAVADLAACAVRGSAAPDATKEQLLAGVSRWLEPPPESPPLSPSG